MIVYVISIWSYFDYMANMSRKSKTPHEARFEKMDNPRLELGTNGLRVRCSTIELVILVVRFIVPG